MMHINGFDIYVKHPAEFVKEVRRSIKERLFSLPFKPFQATKKITEYKDFIEDGKIIYCGNKIFCNPQTYEKLRKELEN